MLCSMCQHGTTNTRSCDNCGDKNCLHIKCSCQEIPYRKLREAFCDMLDGNYQPREIQAQTGLPVERCEEISRMFNLLVRN